MKYYIEFPIPIRCSLKCVYCFHSEAFDLEKEGRFNDKYLDQRPFTLQQYIDWRNKHLSNGTEFLCELHGGEMSHPKNQDDVLNIVDIFDKEIFQLQTNGLGDGEFYRELCKRKAKINRIGFTFHREMIADKPEIVKKYIDNVMLCNSFGIKVYVKELLIKKMRDQILENKKFWIEKGIEFRIQDFKGYGRGKTFEEYQNYTNLDKMLISSEYKHKGTQCSCRSGYKNVLIRGFDIFAGDVICCWDDPCVVGNIMEDWYLPDYRIVKDFSKGHIDVQGIEKTYRGSYPRDTWSPENEKMYPNLTRKDFNRNNKNMLT